MNTQITVTSELLKSLGIETEKNSKSSKNEKEYIDYSLLHKMISFGLIEKGSHGISFSNFDEIKKMSIERYVSLKSGDSLKKRYRSFMRNQKFADQHLTNAENRLAVIDWQNSQWAKIKKIEAHLSKTK
jgi:hypothetical protein